MHQKAPTGMFGFTIVWIGQLISLLGTSMTGFAMTIWAYEETGSATALALVGFFFVTPMLIVSPFAGAIVDRSNRKLMMMISDLAAGVATIIILLLYTSGRLEIWHLYITGAFQGIFQAFQWPAYSAAISTMIPKKQYGRANGMISLAETGSNIFAPILAAAMLGFIGVGGILAIDIFTFVFAIGALLVVFIPQPQTTLEGLKGQGSLLTEAAYGLRYILERPSLLGLQIVFLLGNFFVGIAYAVEAPMILASTGNDEKILAAVNSVGAIGGVVGGLIMTAWGGPKRLVHGVLAGWAVSSLFGTTLLGLANALPGWAIAAFIGSFFIPIINGSNQAIWQAKVASDVQGRVFSIRRLIAWFVSPLAMLIAGPLADKLLEPAMTNEGGFLYSSLGWLVGTGPGSGMSLMFIFMGLAAACVALGGYTVRYIRDVDEILPDHDKLVTIADLEQRRTALQSLLESRQQLVAQPSSPERELALKEISRQLKEIGQRQIQT